MNWALITVARIPSFSLGYLLTLNLITHTPVTGDDFSRAYDGHVNHRGYIHPVGPVSVANKHTTVHAASCWRFCAHFTYVSSDYNNKTDGSFQKQRTGMVWLYCLAAFIPTAHMACLRRFCAFPHAAARIYHMPVGSA